MNPTPSTPQNVDPEEISRFAALASRWWDHEGEMKALHDINPLRASYVDEKARVSGKTLLDVGCGAGLFTEAMAAKGAVVTGIDAGEEILKVARLHLRESKLDIEYRQSTAEEFAARYPNGFDIVSCLEMLEHVPDPASVVRACAGLCRPGGHLFFSSINRNTKAWLLAILGAEYLLNMVPRGTHVYERLVRPSELSRWLREANLRLDDLAGMEYNPVTRTYRISGSTEVNYLVHATKAGK
jgi:2-polyprenyl-6-hydroxyphenyl methylase/3-demethylubiquinone-9 3-methyltransferase